MGGKTEGVINETKMFTHTHTTDTGNFVAGVANKRED
jgi:hypothetical protein